MVWEHILLGIVQGITEWFPVSSSGHLVFLQNFINIQNTVAFDVLVHFASMLVILIVFRKDILRLLFKPSNKLLMLVLATFPIVVAGLLFRTQIKSLFGDFSFLFFSFLITGGILLMSRFRVFRKNVISPPVAFMIGLAQAVALIPGISRSGMTISIALILGIQRREAASFSFLLAIPALFGAFLLELPEVSLSLGPILGFFAALAAGFVSLKLLLRIIQKGYFHWFSVWCFIMALLVFFL